MVGEKAEGWVLREGGCLVIIWVEFDGKWWTGAKGIEKRVRLGSVGFSGGFLG